MPKITVNKNMSNREFLTSEVVEYMIGANYSLNDLTSIKRLENSIKEAMIRQGVMSEAQSNNLSQKVTIREVQKELIRLEKELSRTSPVDTTHIPKIKIKGLKESFREFVGDDVDEIECWIRDSVDNIQTLNDVKVALKYLEEERKEGLLDDDEEAEVYAVEDNLESYAEYLKK